MVLSTISINWTGGLAPSVTLKDADKRLYEACRNGDINAARSALDDNANHSVVIKSALSDTSPLFICSELGHKTIAELLIERGASCKKKTAFDNTSCLQIAASHDHPELVKFLISKGCDPNDHDTLSRTPLMEAAEIGSEQVMEILLSSGADINAIDKENHDALSYALDSVTKDDPKYLKAALYLYKKGANPNSLGRFTRRSLLHCVAASGDFESVKSLVEKHVKINILDHEGHSPMDYASRAGYEQIKIYLEQQITNQNANSCNIL